jgi:quinol monooxygenase YgiN
MSVALSVIAITFGARAVAEPSRQPIVRIAELEIDPAQLDAYKALLTEEIDASVRIEPGVLSLSAVLIKGAPASVRLLEVYADQAAYEAHLKSPHFLKYKTGSAAMVRSLRLIETDPILLRGKAASDLHRGQ